MEQTDTSRRTFLKVGMLAGAGVLGASVLNGCSDIRNDVNGNASVLEEIEWAGIFDVVVIGFGAAGASAAISAAESGARILLTDKAPEGDEGGNSRYSTQLFVSATDREKALEYYQRLRGDFYTPDEVLQAYVDGLCEIKDLLINWGVDEDRILDITDVDVGLYTAGG
jgi:NADPH-dependent 2,4-dienoyl-CoA reductase/sulfur reductase-like enzyme